MTRVAIAFSSKDRVELTRRTLQPLLQPDKFDLHWCDGSKTAEGREFFNNADHIAFFHSEVIGGSCRYIVYALTNMLQYDKYTHVGLVENDVLLDPDWFDATMSLFEHGADDGLKVGAVSPRCYEDRILIQRDGYSVNHNLGAGAIIFTREAAELILRTYRTGWTAENRRIFAILSGIDIGFYWAFRGGEHPLVADWTWDHILASHGMCSLALTPAKATQLEDIAAMGLKMVDAPVEARRNDEAFKLFVERTAQIRSGALRLPTQVNDRLYCNGAHVVFPHQIEQLGGSYSGDWRFKWSLGYGCFAWKAKASAQIEFPVSGPLDVLISGGESGGKVLIEDTHSGFSCDPHLEPEINGNILQVSVPGAYAYRTIRITALTPGVVFYGIRTREAQPSYSARFDFNPLPPL
jgi:hypothetical protein